MTAKEYFEEVVQPSINDFRENPTSRRHAYLASVVVYHLVDHVSKAEGVAKSEIEKTINAATLDTFKIVRGVCNATKHVSADDPKGLIFTSGSELERPPAKLGQARWGVSNWGDKNGGLDIPTAVGVFDLLSTLEATARAFKKSYARHFA